MDSPVALLALDLHMMGTTQIDAMRQPDEMGWAIEYEGLGLTRHHRLLCSFGPAGRFIFQNRSIYE